MNANSQPVYRAFSQTTRFRDQIDGHPWLFVLTIKGY